MAMRSAARHALLTPPVAPGSPGALLRRRFSPRAPGVRPCRAASSASAAPAAGKHLPPFFSVAPMMDWTDNHYRTLARLISRHAWLYTEMVVAETIVHQKDNLDRFLAFPEEQHPIVLQIGGSNLENLSKATELANAYSYDEINLNCGCPSGKVAGHGCFGARLMFDPEFVGDAMSAIAANCDVPVSVKCRIGVDDRDSYEELCESSSDTLDYLISTVGFSKIIKRSLCLDYAVLDHTHFDVRLHPLGSCMCTKKVSDMDKMQKANVFHVGRIG